MGVAFPAHAGMNRGKRVCFQAVDRVPRACGDEPRIAQAAMSSVMRSPRMRG